MGYWTASITVRFPMQDKYITVTQLTRYIKYKIDGDANLNVVFLKGEISNFKAHTRGHFYFTLKDDNSRINAVMFASRASKMKFVPQDGMKVMVTGKVSVYEATGGYQIYVDEMVEDGIGNLYIAFEQLKEKLAKEGLFNPEFKKPIPKYPKVIGIVTAPTGAAIRDILSTIHRRWPLTSTILFPALVQGKEGAQSIAKQIEVASTYPIDVLIVGRGGGSIEDLWCFNEEIVARAIFDCDIPVISAVGHEVDFTIADFVADMRAPTPTGAAEMAVPNLPDVEALLKQITLRLNKALLTQVASKQEKLEQLQKSFIFQNPMTIYEVKEETFDRLYDRLELAMQHIVSKKRDQFLYIMKHRCFTNPEIVFANQERSLETMLSKLEALNPLLTIKRGYSIVRNQNGLVSKVSDAKVDDLLSITVTDGTIEAKVVKEEKKDGRKKEKNKGN